VTITERELALKCDKGGCGRPAFYVVTGHWLHDCETSLGLVLCSQCTATVLQMYVAVLPVTCQWCERSFTKLSDLVECSHVDTGCTL